MIGYIGLISLMDFIGISSKIEDEKRIVKGKKWKSYIQNL